MKPTPYDRHWSDNSNWKWHLVYVCKEDPRIIVPKRPSWAGRTLNFAHPKSFMVLFLTILILTFPCFFLRHANLGAWGAAYILIVGATIAFYYLAKPTLD